MYNFKITDEPFGRGYCSTDSTSKHIRTGNAFLTAAREMELSINPRTGLPDASFKNMLCGYAAHSGEYANKDALTKKAEENPDVAEDYLLIRDTILTLDFGKYLSEDERARSGSSTVYAGTWGGHAVPDFVDYATYGTDGIREKVLAYREKNPDVEDLYDGMLLTLDALDVLGERFCALAKEMAKTAEGDCRRKLERCANTFSYCPKNPAKTFADACAVYVMVFTLDCIDSPGHFDWYMIDFWRRSDYAESREALEDIWQFFKDTRTWNLCIGGSDENWNDKTNELTYEILDVARKFRYNTPNITMRVHRNTPEKLLRDAIETIATGIGMPTFYNDEAVCPALERLGIMPADSHEYIMNGCNQIDIQGKSHMGLEDGAVNLGMCLEFALFNGVGQKWQRKIGTETGDISEFDTFDKFYAAVKAQVKYTIDRCCDTSNKCQRIHARQSSNPLRSMTIKGCIEKGKDYKDGGPLYGHGQILWHGIPDTADSLAAIKKYVYDEKKYTLTEIRDALAANFEGYEEIYNTLKNCPHRFGNDDEYVDDIAGDLVNFGNSYLLTKPTWRGGFFGGGCSPFVVIATMGGAVGAMANGKRAEEKLYGDSIGATPGCDVNGPTALLMSCLKFDHTLPTSGFILNVKFDKKVFCTEKGFEAFKGLYNAFFNEGCGQQLSVTVVSPEDLIDAQKNPDAHRDLIIRIGGYSAHFVELSTDLQNNVIARSFSDL